MRCHVSATEEETLPNLSPSLFHCSSSAQRDDPPGALNLNIVKQLFPVPSSHSGRDTPRDTFPLLFPFFSPFWQVRPDFVA